MVKPDGPWPAPPDRSIVDSVKHAEKEAETYAGEFETCPRCNGTGEDKGHICYKCFGTNYIAGKVK